LSYSSWLWFSIIFFVAFEMLLATSKEIYAPIPDEFVREGVCLQVCEEIFIKVSFSHVESGGSFSLV